MSNRDNGRMDEDFQDEPRNRRTRAIEAYSGSSRLPAEFNAVGKQRGAEARCGVIVIWTRGSK